MGVSEIIKAVLTFGMSPKEWMGLDQVKNNGKACVDIASQFVNSDSKNEEISQIKKYPKKHAALFSGLCLVFLMSTFALWTFGFNMLFVFLSLSLCFVCLYYGGRETKEPPKHSPKNCNQSRRSLMLVFIYLFISLVLLTYTFYLWFLKSYLFQGCMSLVIGLFILMYGLRELILYYQLKFNKKNITLINLPYYFFKGPQK